MTLDRRQALRTLAFGSIGAVAAPAWAETLAEIARGHADHAHTAVAAAAEAAPWAPKVFDAHQNDTVVVLSELIIPQTDTPGAKAAKVNEFVDLVLDDASESDRKQFLKRSEERRVGKESREGWLETRAEKTHTKIQSRE